MSAVLLLVLTPNVKPFSASSAIANNLALPSGVNCPGISPTLAAYFSGSALINAACAFNPASASSAPGKSSTNGFFVFNTVSAVSAFAKTSVSSFGDLFPKYFDTYLTPPATPIASGAPTASATAPSIEALRTSFPISLFGSNG